MCKKSKDGLTRRQRKILNKNTEIRVAAEAARNKGVPQKVILAGIDHYSYSGELPSWIKAAKTAK